LRSGHSMKHNRVLSKVGKSHTTKMVTFGMSRVGWPEENKSQVQCAVNAVILLPSLVVASWCCASGM
jgi:hypothetical protein